MTEGDEAGSRRWKAAAFLSATFLYVWFVGHGWVGVDFGHHWDEHSNVIAPAKEAVENGRLLPRWYYFPSVLHDLALISVAPDALAIYGRGGGEERARIAERLESPFFRLRLRRIVGALTGLAIFWTFLAAFLSTRSWMSALFGAAVVAGSWELHYHSRWITADPLVTQFGALTVLLAVLCYQRQSQRFAIAAAVAAGLACGTKYPGGALLLPVLLATWLGLRRGRDLAIVVAVFSATFLATTPGALFDNSLLREHLAFQLRVYSTGWGAYTVSGFFEHLRLAGEYLIFVLPSPFAPLSLLVFVSAALGAAILVRRDWRLALVVLSFPVAYFLYFSTRKVMIVRNVLVLLPFIALLASSGVAFLLTYANRRRVVRIAAAALLALAVTANLAWLRKAAWTIPGRRPLQDVVELREYTTANPARTFAYSAGVAQALERLDGVTRARLSPLDPRVDEVIFFASEIPDALHQANRRNYSVRWFGSYEVNYNYYPTWWGRDRIVAARPENVPAFQRLRGAPPVRDNEGAPEPSAESNES